MYARIGLRLTYFPEKHLVEAQVQPGLHMCDWLVSEGRALPDAHGLPPFPFPYTAFTWSDHVRDGSGGSSRSNRAPYLVSIKAYGRPCRLVS